jgi:hypothetical protein
LNLSDATTLSREIGCFNVAAAISVVDGHDVMLDAADSLSNWTIVLVTPTVGSSVASYTPMRIKVKLRHK